MMRNGVWVPDGCEVDPDGAKEAVEEWKSDKSEILWKGWQEAHWIKGEPLRPGNVYGSQLSSLYALSLSWDEIAHQFLQCKPRQGDLQNFVNQWLGETWQAARRQATWEEVAERFKSDTGHMTVPNGYMLLTCGVDRQEWGYVYVIDAWGPGRNSHTVDYGDVNSLDELRPILDHEFECEDNRPPMKIDLCLIDSGYRPKGMVDFFREYQRGGRVLPCKGSSSKLPTPYRISRQGKQSALPGLRLVLVDTQETQDWFDAQIYSLKEDDEGRHTVYASPAEMHQDFIEQLLNDAPVSTLDTSNNVKENWMRIDKRIPNDYRDCRRYAYAAMWVIRHGRPIGQRGQVRRRYSQGTRMPDGRPFLANLRL